MPAARVQGDSRIGAAFIEPFAFDPSQLFINNIQGAWYDPSDVNTTWRRNLLTYTEQFNNAPWAALNASISANATTAPDGTTTADAIIENALSGLHLAYYVGAPLSVGANCASVYVKAAGRNFAILRITNPAVSISVNLTTLVAVAAEGTPVGTTVTDVGNGWRRISFSATQVGSGQVQVWASIDGSINPYTGDGASGIYVWGAQLEVGSSATAYQQIVTPEITYASTQLTNLFQDAAGLTPVWAVEQPVGLVFDKRLGPTARRNLLTYTEQFDNAAWATLNASISANATTAPDGTATADTVTATAATGIVYNAGGFSAQTASYTVSVYAKAGVTNQFRLDFVMAAYTSGASCTFTLTGSGTASAITHYGASSGYTATITSVGSGWYRCTLSGLASVNIWYMQCVLANLNDTASFWGAQLEAASTASTYQKITSGVGGEWTPGNHAYQSTAASRPVLRARYNLLTYSEQFDNAAWTLVQILPFGSGSVVNAAIAPDGTTTADLITQNTSGADAHMVRSISAPVTGGSVITASVYLRKPTSNGARYAFVVINDMTAVNCPVLVDLDTGSVVNFTGYPAYGAPLSSSSVNVGGGWWRVTLSYQLSAGITQARVFVGMAANGNPASSPIFTGDGTSGIYVWGAQLLTAADVAATGNAYQRVGASTDYATGGVFRPYLAFDGVDDALATNAVDFTATNKMSVWSGHTRLTTSFMPFVGISSSVAANPTATPGSFLLAYNWSAAASIYNFYLYGTTLTGFATSSAGMPTDVVTMALDIGGATRADNIRPRVNGIVPTLTPYDNPNAGSGNFSNNRIVIGGAAGAWMQGRIYGLIVRGAASSATEVAQTESWLNQRTGAY